MSRLDEVKARGTLRVGVTETSPPFSFRNEQGQIVGYDVDLASAVARRLGVDVTQVVILNKERLSALKDDRVDIVATGMTRSPGRAKEIDFSIDYLVSPHRVLARRDGRLREFKDLAGNKLALVHSASVVDELMHEIPTLQIVYFDHYQAAFDGLRDRLVDGFFADGLLLETYAHKSGSPQDYVLLPGFTDGRTAGFGLKKGEPAFSGFVNRTLLEMEAAGEAAAIYDKWFAPVPRTFRIKG